MMGIILEYVIHHGRPSNFLDPIKYNIIKYRQTKDVLFLLKRRQTYDVIM